MSTLQKDQGCEREGKTENHKLDRTKKKYREMQLSRPPQKEE